MWGIPLQDGETTLNVIDPMLSLIKRNGGTIIDDFGVSVADIPFCAEYQSCPVAVERFTVVLADFFRRLVALFHTSRRNLVLHYRRVRRGRLDHLDDRGKTRPESA